MSEHTQATQLDHADRYMVIGPLSDHLMAIAYDLQEELQESLGEENLWVPSGQGIHIEVAPLVSPPPETSPSDAREMYRQVGQHAVRVLREITQPLDDENSFSFLADFRHLIATPSTVSLVGYQSGSLSEIRRRFWQQVPLLEGVSVPPVGNVLVPLAFFQAELDLEEVREEIAGLASPHVEHVHELRIVHRQSNRHANVFEHNYTTIERFPPQEPRATEEPEGSPVQ